MGAPQNQFAFRFEAAEQAAKRWESRSAQHAKFFTASRTAKYSGLDSKERLAARANRLLSIRLMRFCFEVCSAKRRCFQYWGKR